MEMSQLLVTVILWAVGGNFGWGMQGGFRRLDRLLKRYQRHCAAYVMPFLAGARILNKSVMKTYGHICIWAIDKRMDTEIQAHLVEYPKCHELKKLMVVNGFYETYIHYCKDD